jgi:hypothetical protein
LDGDLLVSGSDDEGTQEKLLRRGLVKQWLTASQNYFFQKVEPTENHNFLFGLQRPEERHFSIIHSFDSDREMAAPAFQQIPVLRAAPVIPPPPLPQIPAGLQDVANAEQYMDGVKAAHSPAADIVEAITYRTAVVEQYSTLSACCSRC